MVALNYTIMFTKSDRGVYMNKQESDILNALLLEPFINQRVLAEVSGHSLGVVNRSLKELIKAGYLNEAICPTAKAVRSTKIRLPDKQLFWQPVLVCGWSPSTQKCLRGFWKSMGSL